MQIFISGTDTDIGKTVISSWLCLHSGYEYFKPIQTGSIISSDSQTVSLLSSAKVHKESYLFKEPCSPHLAAELENQEIDLKKIIVPNSKNLIIEGAGGLLVPLNRQHFIIDLIKYFSVPVILVCSSRLGTINQTLLSLEVLRQRAIIVLGVIIVGEHNFNNKHSIEFYGNVQVIMEMPLLSSVNKENLMRIPFNNKLKDLLRGK